MNNNDTMALILTETGRPRISRLTEHRSVAALPVAGRYRLIDFILSSLVNAGIVNIGVATGRKYASLMDHIGSGKEWDLSRKEYGLFMLPTASTGGDMDTLAAVRSYIHKSRQQYVVLTAADCICNLDLTPALARHKKTGADITLVCKKSLAPAGLTLDVAEDGRVLALENSPRFSAESLGIYILEKSLLEAMIDEATARGKHDFVMDVLLPGHWRLYAYLFEGYAGRVHTLQSYYEANMRFLQADHRRELFSPTAPIYTKIKDQVPARYGPHAKVANSLIADGCIIGGSASDSVLFRGVQVAEGAVVRHCILMQNTRVEAGCHLEYAVLDKECVVRRGSRICGQPTFPVVAGKGTMI